MRAGEMEAGNARLFDVPAPLYNQALKHTFGWLTQRLRSNEELAFVHETELRFFRGFFRQRRKEFKAARERSTVRDTSPAARSKSNAA